MYRWTQLYCLISCLYGTGPAAVLASDVRARLDVKDGSVAAVRRRPNLHTAAPPRPVASRHCVNSFPGTATRLKARLCHRAGSGFSLPHGGRIRQTAASHQETHRDRRAVIQLRAVTDTRRHAAPDSPPLYCTRARDAPSPMLADMCGSRGTLSDGRALCLVRTRRSRIVFFRS